MVGRVVDRVERLEAGYTLFVITGDHGELLGELGIFGPNPVLADGVTPVPMVVHGVDGLDGDADKLV